MRVFLRKLLILAAAYALTLQPVVAAMSAAHARAAAELCASTQRGDEPAPANAHEDDACCLAVGCKAPAGGAPESNAAIVPALVVRSEEHTSELQSH